MAKNASSTSENSAASSEQEIRRFVDSLEQLSGRGIVADMNLIGVLQEIQERFGYLPPEALDEVTAKTGTPLSKIYGVVSFYSQFYTEPRGRHTIRCCRGTACHVKGASRVLDAVKKTLGIEEGQTTDDMQFYLETVACLGACFLAPVMMIDNQYYGRLTPQRVASILKSYRTDVS